MSVEELDEFCLSVIDLTVSGIAIEGYNASCLASLQGMDCN